MIETYKVLKRVAVECAKIKTPYSLDFFKILIKAIKVYKNGSFWPVEAHHLGFFSPGMDLKDTSHYVSRSQQSKNQSLINPIAWESMGEDKSIFYRHCKALGLPVPDLYAICFRKTAGWSYLGKVMSHPNDWFDFFENQVPSNFFLKPSRGVYGAGARAFQRVGTQFKDSTDRQFSASEVYDLMVKDKTYSSYIIQEVLTNHTSLVELSGAEALQTARIITLVDENGSFRIMFVFLKIIIGSNIIDNFDYGRTGNLMAEVDCHTGAIYRVIQKNSMEDRFELITHHPQTNVQLKGFPLPWWEETCTLVEKAAKAFLPIRTIGWDIAFTPTGPSIIEANMWWDPPNLFGVMGRIREEMLN